MNNEIHVYRVHLKSGNSEDKDYYSKRERLINFCLGNEKKYIAVGWSCVYEDQSADVISTIKDYESYDKALYSLDYMAQRKRNPIHNILKETKENDLFWTRDLDGSYWICRATCEAQPSISIGLDKKTILDLDIGVVIPVEAYKVGLQIPAQIKTSFTRPRSGTGQIFSDDTTINYSKFIFNKKSNKKIYEINTEVSGDIINNLPPLDLEELVISYIQIHENYYLLSNSIARKSTTVKIECEFISRDINCPSKAVVQVKGGNTAELDGNEFLDYINDGYKVYIYAPKMRNSDKCIVIQRSELLDFYEKNKSILPRNITMWENLFNDR